jgi:hypothetical protein
MSFSTQIDNCIRDYIRNVSIKYSISFEELYGMWSGSSPSSSSSSNKFELVDTVSPSIPISVPSAAPIAAKKKQAASGARCEAEITKRDKTKEICGGPVCADSKSGKYCSRHLKQEAKPEPKISEMLAPVQKKAPVIGGGQAVTKEELSKKIEERKTQIEIRKNTFGNYEHYGSGILIDRTTGEAYGKQNRDGSTGQLSREDIELCKSIGFNVRKPNNILSANEQKGNKPKVTVEDIDEDDDDMDDDIDDMDDIQDDE